ncbi:hypothetical protein SAMN04488104_10612 [Algoriphagus faecimaris]|uniref:Uncharacterized protein n=1 Tax=Algoriphagus faecimaris TaxID=686796 RepID=A0A1G6XK28_9BACT|nr:hypothetical protein [Algoriphagus faecimaris]SDD78539.1 hypothetical protein SAMN04488104_10612 [Algoriphagus faecimaris]
MKTPSYLHFILGIAFAGLFACGGAENSKNDSAPLASSESEEKVSNSSTSSGPVSKSDLLDWLPMNHAGFTREKEPSVDHGDLPRVQVRYIYDENPEKRFTLDILDGKGPLVVAVNGMINANLGEEYDEPLLDGYAKVYINKGIKAFERHTPADGKAFLQYAVDDRFYFNFQGEQMSPDVFWEFQKILDPLAISP